MTETKPLKFSLCLETVYPEYDPYDKIKIAAEQGFDGVEFWEVSALDPDKVRRTCEDSHIALANINALNGWEIHMARPYPLIEKNMREAFRIGAAMGAQNLLILAGMQESRQQNQESLLTANLSRLAEFMDREKESIQVSIEPLNTIVDHRGYGLDSSITGFQILSAVNHPKIRLVYDIYHMQIMEGNVIANLMNHLDLVGHIHSAGCPGRHEHFYGENDYPNILRQLAKAGYTGFVGCEYMPTYDTKKSTADVLRYLKSYQDTPFYGKEA